jgi:subtilisin family serine protease
MKTISAVLAFTLWFAVVLLASTPPLGASPSGGVWPAHDPIDGEYIVVLHAIDRNDVDAVAAALLRTHGGSLIVTLKNGVKCFGARMSAIQAGALALDPQVDHVEENGKAFLSYSLQEFGADTSWWHLDRIDNRGPLYPYRAYAYTSTGANVNAYVLDTGILGTHEQFGGRVLPGWTFGDGLPANNPCGGYPSNPDADAPDYGPGHGSGATIHPPL